ncbi:hypothetical protein DRP04_14855 [Archaeoglobales archaeon]|nr:MAG: hypothetical protein DRP04_14855 [Archaeoglobales archaeon]
MPSESRKSLLWIFAGLTLATASLTFQFLVPQYLYSRLIVAAVPYIIASLPFVRDYFEKRGRERKVKNRIKEIKSFLKRHFTLPIKDPDISEFDLDVIKDEDIYISTIKGNFEYAKDHEVYSLLLCFYCSLCKVDRIDPEIYDRIQKISKALGLNYYELNESVKTFLKFYHALLLSKKSKYSGIDEITNADFEEERYKTLLKDYISKYQKDLVFLDVKEKLHQSENLRQTLVRLIKDGKLSSWGVTKESLKKLEEELRKKTSYSKTFLVIGNKIKGGLREYLTSQPRLSAKLTSVDTPFKPSKFTCYIIRPQESFESPKKFLEKLKKLSEDREQIIFVIPLDLVNSEYYTHPHDQSFTSKNLQECFSIMRWFTYGYESQFADADIWSIIASSTITPEELLSILPFNILCEGIFPAEQEYFIKHYEKIKERCGIEKITDWGRVKPEIIVEYLLEEGYPKYAEAERSYLLREYAKNFDLAVRERLLKLCRQIVENSRELEKSLSVSPLIE